MCYNTKLSQIQADLFSYVRKKIHNKDDAFDIVQDTNFVLINKEPNYDYSRSFKGWAFGVARWQILAYFKTIKRRARIQSLDVTGFSSEFIGLNSNWLADVPFAHLIRKERMELIKGLDRTLTNRQKQIFNLLLDGSSPQEIASRTGLSIRNIQSLKSRLIERIKKFVTNNKDEKYHNY